MSDSYGLMGWEMDVKWNNSSHTRMSTHAHTPSFSHTEEEEERHREGERERESICTEILYKSRFGCN